MKFSELEIGDRFVFWPVLESKKFACEKLSECTWGCDGVVYVISNFGVAVYK